MYFFIQYISILFIWYSQSKNLITWIFEFLFDLFFLLFNKNTVHHQHRIYHKTNNIGITNMSCQIYVFIAATTLPPSAIFKIVGLIYWEHKLVMHDIIPHLDASNKLQSSWIRPRPLSRSPRTVPVCRRRRRGPALYAGTLRPSSIVY